MQNIGHVYVFDIPPYLMPKCQTRERKEIYSACINLIFYIPQKYQIKRLFIFRVSITPRNFITKY